MPPELVQRTRTVRSERAKTSQMSAPITLREDGVPSAASSSTSVEPMRFAPSVTASRTRRAGGGSYWIVLITLKIGRYIATIIPPTIDPRTTIMIGSIALSRASTATSTSSS